MQIDYSSPDFGRRRRSRVPRYVVLGALAAVVVTLVMVSRPLVAKRQTQEPLRIVTPKSLQASVQVEQTSAPIDEIQAEALDAAMGTHERQDWITVTVKPGDALSTLFDRQGIAATEWMRLLKLGGDVDRLSQLRVGDVLRLRKSGNELEALTFALDEARTLQINRDAEGGFRKEILEAEIERRTAYAMGVIDSSLFMAGGEAGLSDKLIMDMANIFGYDVDFALDIRQGDRFTVVYEELYKNGDKLRDGEILAAEFVNQRRSIKAVRHTLANGDSSYYTPEGDSMKKAFIRTPLDVFRISSHFNLRRKHPVLNRIRAHRGTDYAAPTGTPIKATGDGKIVHLGTKGGYGRAIIIQHGSTYRTLYAHMSRYRKGLRTGSRVKQGQVIGYVGASGLASGPHLHYEFLVNGVHRNPLSVSLPRAEPVPRSEQLRFKHESKPLLAQLEVLSQTQTAQLDL